MSVTKRIYGDYNISTELDPTANITLSTHTVYIKGNLLVGGNATSVTKTDIEITDNKIVLNKGEIGSGVTLGEAGIEIDRGLLSNVTLRWNETTDTWQITTDGATYGNILTSTGAATITLISDPAPQLGGNLDVLARNIFSSSTANVRFDSNLAVQYTTVTPATYSGYNVIFANTPSTGGSGLRVTNTTNQDQELATQRRNIVYSLVL
jgi:hypothetical protein